MTHSLRATGAFAAYAEDIANIVVFPENQPADYPNEFIENTWNRVFSEAETKIDQFVSEHPDADRYLIKNKNHEISYLMPLIHNGMHQDVIDYIAEAFARGDHGYCGNGRKMSLDYILDWYEQHYPEVVPQSLSAQIYRTPTNTSGQSNDRMDNLLRWLKDIVK